MPLVHASIAAMKRTPYNASFQGLVHVVYMRDHRPKYHRTLCYIVLEDIHPYLWTADVPTCVECIAEDEWTPAIE